MKFIDYWINHCIKRFGNKKFDWDTFSFFVWMFTGKLKLRVDYIEYTARRYAVSVNQCLIMGYQPLNYDWLKEEYWLEELKKLNLFE